MPNSLSYLAATSTRKMGWPHPRGDRWIPIRDPDREIGHRASGRAGIGSSGRELGGEWEARPSSAQRGRVGFKEAV